VEKLGYLHEFYIFIHMTVVSALHPFYKYAKGGTEQLTARGQRQEQEKKPFVCLPSQPIHSTPAL